MDYDCSRWHVGSTFRNSVLVGQGAQVTIGAEPQAGAALSEISSFPYKAFAI